MSNRKFISFEVNEELKDKIKKMAENYNIDGITYHLKVSAFCRVAIVEFIKDLEEKYNE